MPKRSSNSAQNVSVDDKLSELGLADGDEVVEEQESDDELAEGDEDEQDDEVDKDGDKSSDPLDQVDEEHAVPTRRSKLRDALFAGEAKPPRVSAPPAAPSVVQAVNPLPRMEEDPVYVVPPERVRKVKREPPPSVKRMGGALAKKLPGAERVKIKKRLENGQLGLIGEYTAADLASCSDVEMFIMRFIKPKYGPGVYKLTGIDAAGNELEAGEIPVLDPIEPSTSEGAMGLVQQLIEQTQRQQREMMESRMQQPAVDLIGTLKGLQEVQANMTAQATQPQGDGGLASVMAVMIQAMQQQAAAAQASQQQMTQLLVAAMQPREDPTMKLLLAKLVEERSSSSGSSALPPPLPPSSPLEGLKEIVEVLAVVMGSGKKGHGDDEIKDLLKAALTSKKEETLTPRETIQLMHEMQASRGTDDFRKSMENMSMVMQVATNLKGQSEGSSSAGFFDALSALFSNRDFAGSIANSIRAKVDAQAHATRIAQEQALIRSRQQLLREARAGTPAAAVVPGTPAAPGVPGVAQRPQGTVVPMQRAGTVAQGPRIVQPPVQAPPAPVVVMPPPAAPRVDMGGGVELELSEVDELLRAAPANDVTAPPVEATKPATTPAPVPEAAQPPRPAYPRIPKLPAQAGEHVQHIVHAKDDAELIERTVRMLIYFAEFPEWRPMTEMLLTMVQRGERDRAIVNVERVVTGLSAMAVMTPELARRITHVFGEHFDEIQGGLADLLPLNDGDGNPFEEALADDEEDDDDDDDDQEDEDADEDEEDQEASDDEEDDEEDEDEDEDEDDEAVAGH